MYSISGFYKSTEQDDFNNGCIGNGSDDFIEYRISTATIDEMKEKIASFIGVNVSDLELDACEEAGRIESGRTETEDGSEASSAEIAAWKAGEMVLFYAVYSAYVMECKPVSCA